MIKRKLTDIINEEVKKVLTEAKWPTDNGKPSYWEFKNRWTLSPGGGWSMTFGKGSIYKIEDVPAGQKISYWDAMKNDWIPRTPPISSYREKGTFDLDSWGYQGQGWVDDWMRNTTKLSQSQAESKAKAKEAVKVVSAREGAKLLAKLPGNQKVKITFIK